MKNKTLVLLCLISMFTASLACGWEINTEPEVGEAGDAAPFLKTGVGPRALAMGNAFISIADDSSAAYWNPAGIAYMKENQAGFIYSKMSLDRDYNFASVSLPGWRVAASAIMSGVRDIPGYDALDNPTGSFDEKNIAMLFSYAYKLSDDLSAGANLKVISAKIQDASGFGYGADLGLMAKVTGQLSAAIVLQDLYTKLNWTAGHTERVPLVGKIGASYDLFAPGAKSYNLKLSADAEKYSTRKRTIFNFGSEFSLPYNLALRAGIADNFLTAGFGLRFKFAGLDYCYKVDKMKLENTNQLSLSLFWGGTAAY
jgi:hypothetical protein